MSRLRELEDEIEVLFYEIGKYQAVTDERRKSNVFRMKQAYDILQQEYRERTGAMFEPKDLNRETHTI